MYLILEILSLPPTTPLQEDYVLFAATALAAFVLFITFLPVYAP